MDGSVIFTHDNGDDIVINFTDSNNDAAQMTLTGAGSDGTAAAQQGVTVNADANNGPVTTSANLNNALDTLLADIAANPDVVT